MRKLIFYLVLSLGLSGCSIWPRLTTKPTVPTSTQKATVKRTTKPTVVVSRPDETVTVVAQEETAESLVEYTEPGVKGTSRSIWTKWWWWVLIAGLVTYLGLWPVIFKVLRKWKKAFRQTVFAIQASQATKDPETKRALDAYQSPETKALVEKTKSG